MFYKRQVFLIMLKEKRLSETRKEKYKRHSKEVSKELNLGASGKVVWWARPVLVSLIYLRIFNEWLLKRR